MTNALKIFVFAIAVSAFYSYVGQMVPQKETYPPEAQELGADLSPEEMVEVGRAIVEEKGTCLTCHTIGSEGALRFPDLAGIGARAASRRDGYSDVDYLAESLYEPGAYIVEGFQPGMPAIGKPPINLSDQEILAVIAYLQSLGGTPSVTMQTHLKYQGQTPAPQAATATSEAAPPAVSGGRDGETLFTEYVCNTCHNIDDPARLVGPSLYDVGNRLTKAQIFEAILEPDATVAEGYPAGVMPAMLQAGGFYDKVSSSELKSLVDYLASKKGK